MDDPRRTGRIAETPKVHSSAELATSTTAVPARFATNWHPRPWRCTPSSLAAMSVFPIAEQAKSSRRFPAHCSFSM